MNNHGLSLTSFLLPLKIVVIVVIANTFIIPFAQPLKKSDVTVEIAKFLQVRLERIRKALDVMLGVITAFHTMSNDKLVEVITHKIEQVLSVSLKHEKFAGAREQILLPIFHSLEEITFVLRDIMILHRLKEFNISRP